MSEETPKTEEELLAEWTNMAAESGDEATEAGGEEGEGGQQQRVLDQNEIDSLLGVDSGDSGSKGRGIQALLDQNVVNYEKLPMLEVVFDKFERYLSTSLRHFTADNVDVSLVKMTSVRFGDYLNSVPLPAGLVVVKAVGLDDYILMVYESQLIYTVVDVLLGGRRAHPAAVEGRSFTTIERSIMDNMTDLVMRDMGEAFAHVAPIRFEMERMEVNPRFAMISQETNVSILVTLRVALEGREGLVHFCLPYATLEPIRDQLLQQFMGEKFGQDNIWENHLSQELYFTGVEVSAIMDEMEFPLQKVLEWRVGDTIVFDAESNSPIRLNCRGVTKMVGQMGRAKDYVAVQVVKNINDVNNEAES